MTPAAVGGVALNLRYLNKAKVEPADAAASVGVSQVFAFAMHLTLLVIFAALTGTSHSTSLKPPGWVYIALAVLAAAALVGLSFPAGRRLVRSRIAPALGQVVPRLLDIAQRPAKLAEGIGGAFVVTAAYILCLAASVRAVGGHVAFVGVAIVFLTGSALGSVVPTPGGLGAVEAALSAGPDSGRPAGRRGRQRGAAVPAADVLAAGPGRVGRAELPAAAPRPLARGYPPATGERTDRSWALRAKGRGGG